MQNAPPASFLAGGAFWYNMNILPAMGRSKGHAAVSAAVIAFLLFLAGAGGLWAFLSRKTPPDPPPAEEPALSVLGRFLADWPALEKTIPDRPVLGSTVWSPPLVVQFLRDDAILAEFEDGHVRRFAVFAYAPGTGFSLAEAVPAANTLLPADWAILRAKYGSDSYPPRTFEFRPSGSESSYRPADWQEVPANPYAERLVASAYQDLSFSYPNSWQFDKTENGAFSICRDFGSGASPRSGCIAIRALDPSRCPCSAAALVRFMMDDAVYDASGAHPSSASAFQKVSLGGREFYRIRTGRFEGTLGYNYYLPDRNRIYVFSFRSQGVDWTNPDLDEDADPVHAALKSILAGLRINDPALIPKALPPG